MNSAHQSARRRLFTAAVTSVLAGGMLLAGALPASAHVHVETDDATAGGYSVLTFRVPNESDTAGTVKVAVTLPDDHPFLYVSTKPVPGWTVAAPEEKLPNSVKVDETTITKGVRTITWTARKGTRIEPNEFQEFAVSVGPLPASTAANPTTILFPVAQTYSDGKVVNWNQKTPASGEEPANPAPEITVGPAVADDQPAAGASPTMGTQSAGTQSAGTQSAGTQSAGTSSGGQPAQTSTSAPSTDTTARVLAGIGLVLGVAALAVALIGRRRGGSA